jgi:hypothetical protein
MPILSFTLLANIKKTLSFNPIIHSHSSALTPEEVDVSKLLHLLDIAAESDFLVVEQRPALATLRQVLLDESNVVAGVDRGAFVADDAVEAEVRGLRV